MHFRCTHVHFMHSTMPPARNRLILSLCIASGCVIGGSASFVAPASRSTYLAPPLPSTPNGVGWRLFGRRGGGGGKKEKKPSKSNLPEKICAVCQRPFTWRKKWERCWDEVTCCSKSCNAQRRALAKEG